MRIVNFDIELTDTMKIISNKVVICLDGDIIVICFIIFVIRFC
jgi:hypothetical protein